MPGDRLGGGARWTSDWSGRGVGRSRPIPGTVLTAVRQSRIHRDPSSWREEELGTCGEVMLALNGVLWYYQPIAHEPRGHPPAGLAVAGEGLAVLASHFRDLSRGDVVWLTAQANSETEPDAVC